MRSLPAPCVASLLLAACSANSSAVSSLQPPAEAPIMEDAATRTLYQPLAVGDAWTYTCRDIKSGGENGGMPFTIVHRVLGKIKVGAKTVYELKLEIPQVPSKPLRIDPRVTLVANDAQGDLMIYGYLLKNNKVRTIKPTRIVSNATPASNAPFNYMGPSGGVISRLFFGIESTNPTPLGTFTVADYEESGNIHDYGYARGVGVAEEDHGPNYEVDCLIEKAVVH